MTANHSKEELEELLNDSGYKFEDHYIFRAILGKGAFGVVVEAISKDTLEALAIKIIEKSGVSYNEIEKIKGEAKLLNSLEHPHIVALKKVYYCFRAIVV